MRIENVFEVPATPEAAWALLTDVPRVVTCMPGVELERVIDDSTWEIVQRVKLGPISLAFRSEVRRAEMDETERRAVLAVSAKEARGRGGADATVDYALEPAGDGTRVTIATELELRGTVAQYGRPVVGSVAEDLTRQFATCLSSMLASEPSPAPGAQVEPVGGLRLLLGSFLRRARRRS